MCTIVHTIDPEAFMTITEVEDVFTSVYREENEHAKNNCTFREQHKN